MWNLFVLDGLLGFGRDLTVLVTVLWRFTIERYFMFTV